MLAEGLWRAFHAGRTNFARKHEVRADSKTECPESRKRRRATTRKLFVYCIAFKL